MNALYALLAVGVLGTPVLAQSGLEPAPRTTPARAARTLPHPVDPSDLTRERRVHFDRPGDGALWAVGANWKMKFDAEGATYVPYLGSDAPRNYPIEFQLESLSVGGVPIALQPPAPAVRDGNRVLFQRGPVVEAYELDPERVEQLFHIAERSAAGDMLLNVRVESELARSERSQSLVLANERGEVSYSKAIALDSAGARQSLDTRWKDGSVEIRVSAEFLASATFPLTIDPVLSTVSVSPGTSDDTDPDVAWDETHGVFIVVFDRQFSVSDHDIYSLFLTEDGASVPFSAAYIDSTSSNWRNPSVANLNGSNDFLVVAEEGADGSRRIRGRIRSGSGALDSQVALSPVLGEELNPVVGGDSYDAPGTNFLLVYESRVGSDHDIRARLIGPDGSYASSILAVDSSPEIDTFPSVSKSNFTGIWNIAWQRRVTDDDHDIQGARINASGNFINSSFSIDTSSFDDKFPSASSQLQGSGDYLVVWRRNLFGTHVIRGHRLHGTASLEFVPVSSMDGSPDTPKALPDVDSDGCRFLVTYSEESGVQNTDAYATTLNLTPDGLEVDEGHVLLGGSPVLEGNVRVASTGSAGGEPGRFLSVWDQGSLFATEYDIEAAVFDAEAPQNDCCAYAEPIAGLGLFAFNNEGATTDGQPHCNTASNQIESDVWFRWNAPGSGVYSISTCGATGVDTAIGVYLNAPCQNLSAPISCNDDACGDQSQVVFDAMPGTYWIRVGSSPGTAQGGGVFRLHLLEGDELGDPYCIAASNSVSGSGATIEALGSTSVLANDLTLRSTGLPPNVPGIFYFGELPTQVPFGNGFRCVGGATFRLPIVFASPGGQADHAIDNTVGTGTQLGVGLTWHFQFWYRDPSDGPAGFNLSRGLELTFML